MALDIDENEMQYIVYLQFYYSDTTLELIADTFNYWFDRNIDAMTLERSCHGQTSGKFADLEPPNELIKEWPPGQWNKGGSFQEGSDH